MRPCYAFSAKTATKPAVLAIDDEIGFWGTQAKEFRAALAAVDGDELVVEINSPGGDVFAGLGMYNMLRSFSASGKKLTTRAVGLAGSIASVLLLAGDKREITANSMVMIHGVSSGAWGTVEDIEDCMVAMKKVQTNMRAIYVARMGLDDATADAYMAKDNWFTADEALAARIVTDVTETAEVTAKFNVARAALPEHVAKIFAHTLPVASVSEDPAPAEPVAIEPEVLAPEELEPAAPCAPVAEAIAIEAKAMGLEAYGAFFAISSGSVDEAKQKMNVAREISALCKVVARADAASAFIRGGKTVAEARASLMEALSATDQHVDNAPPNNGTTNNGTTNGETAKPAVVSSNDLWASHNKVNPKKGR